MGWSRGWKPYVPVAKRRALAAKELAKLEKSSKGEPRSPVRIETRKMATTFWGEAWCDNLENYSDFSNRLPRGKTYARNGSILDLKIEQGCVNALVSGSSLYKIQINIKTLTKDKWENILSDCSQSIHSMMDLLRGKLSDAVMKRMTAPKIGMFPQPNEIDLKCSCPDFAHLCKHLAAVMYGIGNRLDFSPELLFLLRGVDKNKLISEVISSSQLSDSLTGPKKPKNAKSTLADEDLGSLFGIDLVSDMEPSNPPVAKKTRRKPKTDKQVGAKPAKAKKASTKASTKAGRKVATHANKAAPSKRVVPKVQVDKTKTVARKKKQAASTPTKYTAPGLPASLRIALENSP
jgi:uncharacterized Zn finger protein